MGIAADRLTTVTIVGQEFGLIAAPCRYEPDFYHISAGRLGLEALREDLRSGAKTWLGRAVARHRSVDSRRFDDMEQEGWIE